MEWPMETGYNVGTCVCNSDYVGTIGWNPVTKTWDNGCTPFTCPAGQTNMVTAGVNTCVDVECPEGPTTRYTTADGSVKCGCQTGTTGSVDWEKTTPSTGHWVQNCVKEDCPADTVYDHTTYPSGCKCTNGRPVIWEHPRVNYTATNPFGTPDTSMPKTWVPKCLITDPYQGAYP